MFVVDNIIDTLFDELWDKCKQSAKAAESKETLKAKLRAEMSDHLAKTYRQYGLDEKFELAKLDARFMRELYGKVALCFNATTYHLREQAKQALYQTAYEVAQAKNDKQKWAVQYYLEALLSIIRDHFLNERDNLLLANHTVDQIREIVAGMEALLIEQGKALERSFLYKGSFAELIDSITPKRANWVQFHYLNPVIGFYGREQEIAQLNSFLADERQLSFGVITGPGGAGKSKFAYSYMNARVDPRWKAVYLSKESLELVQNFPNWEYPQDLLLVVDYAGESAEELGTLLSAMNERQTRALRKKIRLLLIERQGASRDATSGTLIWPTWFEHFRKEGERRIALEELLYRFDPERYFLSLPALNENDLRKIAEDYVADASHSSTRRIGGNDWESIYEHTQEIEHRDYAEKDAVRPLILLLVVDAWMSTTTFREWDYSQVLDHIIKRYKRHWKDTLCQGNKQLYENVERLLLYATATGGLSINDEMPALLKPYKDELVKHLTWNGVHSLICGLNSSDNYQGRLQPLEPDLIGEHFVLEVIQEKLRGTEEGAAFIADLWENSRMVSFLARCIFDLASKETPFRALFQQGAQVLIPQETQVRRPVLAAYLLVVLVAAQQLADATETVACLGRLASEYTGNAEIALCYARGLVGLLSEQDATATEATVEHLERLASEYTGNAEITLCYARGLAVLSLMQDAAAVVATVEHLGRLTDEYAGNAEIALTYVVGLLHPSFMQDVATAVVNVRCLERLVGEYKSNSMVASAYAGRLLMLSLIQDADAAAATVIRLEQLVGDYEGNAEIALRYAKGLFNLMTKRNNNKEYFSKLKKVTKPHRHAPEFRELIEFLPELLVD